MATTIADLEVKIGANSSGLQKELDKTNKSIAQAFKTNPVKEMEVALKGTTGSLETLIGRFGGLAALAASGFGLTNIIKGAVEAGNRTYELGERMHITKEEAAQFSRILKLTGGDSDLASKAFMRLDSTISGSGEAAEKTKAILNAVNVSLTDQNGKLLPVNQQLEQLAKGYKRASDAGYGQEFIMNTLGARGLSLVKTLQDYNEAAANSKRIQGIGLNAKEMHEISVELGVVQAQLGQLANAGGATLAPIAKELLPPILEGLQKTAKFIAENKENLTSLTKTLLVLTVVYKSFKAVQTASAAMSGLGLLGTGGQAVAGQVVEEALTTQQEKSIARRIKNIEAAALAEEKAYFKTLKTSTLTDAEKEKSYTEYCIIREAKAAETARVEAERMTAAYQTINAQARQSAVVQAEAAGSVETAHTATATKIVAANKTAGAASKALAAEQTAVTVATTQAGNAATVAGAKMVTATSGAAGPLRNAISLVWALAGGWLGVAAGITAAIYKLYEFHEADKKEANEAQYVNVNGKDYYYSKRENTMLRRKDNGTIANVYDKSEAEAAKSAWDAKYAKANKNSEELKKEYGDEPKIDISSQLEALKTALNADTAATKEKTKAIKEYTVESPIGQEVVNIASRHPEGEQWRSPLVEDARVQCAAFVSALYQEAGIQGLNSVNGNELVNQFGTAYHSSGTGYIPQEGDMIDWKDHVGIYAGNGEYIARNSTGGVHRGSMAEAEQYFGRVQGYGSVGEFTGGRTVQLSTDEAGKKANEALKRLNQAKEEAIRLFYTMQEAINEETEGSYAAGMDKIAEDVRKKQEEINKLSATGVPKDAIDQLEKQLSTYESVMKDKVYDAWKENWNKIKTETKQVNAELTGDFKALADAEYTATVNALDKEKEERLKAVAQKKDDVEAMAAVEEWYTAKTKEAAQKRTEAYRESFEKQAKYAIENHKSDLLKSLTSGQEGKDFMNWKGQTEALETYLSIWQEGHKSMEEQMAEMAESSQEHFQDFFQSILTGSETMGDAFMDLLTGLGESIMNEISNKWAGQITDAIFGGSLLGGGKKQDSGAGGGEMDTLFTSFKDGLGATVPALNLLTGSSQKGGLAMGAYNLIQNAINTGTKPTEIGTTVTATAAITAFTTSVITATGALAAMSATSGLHFLGFATGGPIIGPGTGTSDSIPAWLSNGEYVVKADAVKRVGLPVLNAINAGQMPRFAKGGAVKSSNIRTIETATVTSGNKTVQLNISTLDASSFTDFLRNGGGEEINRYVNENSLNFNPDKGVW